MQLGNTIPATVAPSNLPLGAAMKNRATAANLPAILFALGCLMAAKGEHAQTPASAGAESASSLQAPVQVAAR